MFYREVQITPLGVTVLIMVILMRISFCKRMGRASADVAVTVLVRVDVVQLFTWTVRVEVGSVIVTLRCTIPDATVTGLGVLGTIVSSYIWSSSWGQPCNVFVVVVKKGSTTVLVDAIKALTRVEVKFLSRTEAVHRSRSIRLTNSTPGCSEYQVCASRDLGLL